MIRASDPRNREDWSTICKIATEREEVLGALGLVHDEYVRSGLSMPSESGLRVTRYHLLNTTEILVGLVDEQVACTLSLVRDSRFGLPMESIYHREVHARRRLGKRVAEVSCLADRRSGAKDALALMLRLMTLLAQVARYRGVDELLIAVHPHHVKFYERFLGFTGFGDLRYYSTVCGNPAVAMALDLARLHAMNPKAYKLLCGQPYSSRELRERTISLALLEELSGFYMEMERDVATEMPQPTSVPKEVVCSSKGLAPVLARV
ncbi:MAG: N-acyl amino acid synthase FeeM domain-containing protein [Pirellulaceae bacterium]